MQVNIQAAIQNTAEAERYASAMHAGYGWAALLSYCRTR